MWSTCPASHEERPERSEQTPADAPSASEGRQPERALAEVRPPRAFRFVETSALIACLGFELVLVHHVFVGFRDRGMSVLAALGVGVLGYLAADFIAGFVHFVGDSFGTVDMPVLGSTFILPFRRHHDLPNKIRTNDFVETNGNNAIAALLVVVPTTLLVPVRSGGVALGAGLFVAVFTAFVSATNQIHKWAHTPSPPAPVKLLQRAGIILSPRRHGPHHRAPHRQGYCVTVGLFNLLLDPIGFFPWVERVLRTILGLAPAPSARAARAPAPSALAPRAPAPSTDEKTSS